MKVFINYSRKDEVLATKLVAMLEDAGFDAWFKKREILPGDNWAEKISQGLKESNAMVAHSARQPWTQTMYKATLVTRLVKKHLAIG